MRKYISDSNRYDLDLRFRKALDLFNSGNWYPAHDALEELWHEALGPERLVLQGLLQIAVAQVHLENGNLNGATILYGEGLGRLRKKGLPDLGLEMDELISSLECRLKSLQQKNDIELCNIPRLRVRE